ncbi:hypothetical protein FRUB_03510 [Fimbriiglobus ruber]|uniref:Uncharacterized protein n=1 Tax=Fimbriiglobus ruber TaxID=1908690 RepID=A0A225DRI0_9BACT|nr:hypothetical protein FRUB_03510 [Fimbriiglobus ruber]
MVRGIKTNTVELPRHMETGRDENAFETAILTIPRDTT